MWLIEVFKEVRNPRDENAQHDLGSTLFLALAATRCGARSCIRIAEFGRARTDELQEMAVLPHEVLFEEDDTRTRKDHTPENLAVLRRLAQNILHAHPLDRSMVLKMCRAMWSKDFFSELFSYMR